MRRETVFVTLSVCITIVAASAIIARGGPLDPPQGPISPSYKTLDEVEPRIPIGPDTTPGDADALYKITEPGAYYLTGNLAGTPGKHGIEIAASNVSLDLRGHTLVGGADSLDAILVSDAFSLNIEIAGGALESWGGSGVSAATATGIRIENLSVTLCSNIGVIAGPGARISDCTATFGSRGIRAGSDAIVRACVVEQMSIRGIEVDRGSVVRDSVARACGVAGIEAPEGRVTIVDCVSGESTFGISVVGIGSTIRGCLAYDNSNVGIIAGAGALVVDCTSRTNDSDGFAVGSASVVRSCIAYENGASGICALSSGTITGCTARRNGDNGISFNSSCLVTDNVCEMNDAAGFRSFFDDNRIEANVSHANSLGFDVDGERNIVVRNHARANGQNFAQVEPGNILGAIVSDQNAMNAAENDLVNFSF